ncbi:MAG TPA: anti-sigma factor antagonist [Chromatiales bacterium]|nr:anti-sigma factor antagonist [Chromatiales bacterium]
MQSARLVSSGSGVFRLEGALDFDTVPLLLAESEALFRGLPKITVDLAGVTHANSAALGLLLEWVDRTQAAGQQIRFLHLPDALAEIARVSHVTSLLEDVIE